jgi:hypothetical protein
LAEAWNGTTWQIQSTPVLSGATNSALEAVSCSAADLCTAVGRYNNQSGRTLTLAERWNGSTWSVQTTPDPKGAPGSESAAVACPAANACTAVGNYYPLTGNERDLAEGWNGTTWSIQPVRSPAGVESDGLYGVSCLAPYQCMAVGGYSNAGFLLSFSESWNGRALSIRPVPNPSGTISSNLNGISCLSSTSCIAVGAYETTVGGGDLTLAARWDGSTWSIQPTPNPPEAQSSAFGAVSCSGPDACTAVGDYEDSAGTFLNLAERWNGATWTVQTTPDPKGAQSSELTGVSCPAAAACTAVGSYVSRSNLYELLAERWNGKTWSRQATPNAAGADGGVFNDVACTAASACTAVGDYGAGSTQPTLVEVWNGTAWTVQTSPDQAVPGSLLYSVACPASNACTSVGSYITAGLIHFTLAEAT